MPSKKMLNDTVVIYNFIGEVDDEATFQASIVENCYCEVCEGTQKTKQGVRDVNTAKLFIFNESSKIKSPEGNPRQFVPYEQWLALIDKSSFWTVSDSGHDYFVKGSTPCASPYNEPDKFRITRFNKLDTGSKRIRHIEVDGS